MAQVTLNPSINAYIRSTDPTGNVGDSAMFVGEVKSISNDVIRSLIKFDLSSIPSGSTITGVTLRIYDLASDFADNNRTLRAYRLLRTWVENQATWNIYSTGNNWGTAGAGNTSTDREATDIGSVATPGIEVAQYYEIALTAAKVQEWFVGTLTNNGLLLQMDTETDDCHYYAGRDDVSGHKPELVVTYTPPPSGFFALL
jgi:hypothetical protein